MLVCTVLGVLASHTALKEHAETLEANLAQLSVTASVTALDAHVSEELGRKDNQVCLPENEHF